MWMAAPQASSLLPPWFNRDEACAPDTDMDAARHDEDECDGGVLLDGPDGPDMSDSSSQHDVGCGSGPCFLGNAMTVDHCCSATYHQQLE